MANAGRTGRKGEVNGPRDAHWCEAASRSDCASAAPGRNGSNAAWKQSPRAWLGWTVKPNGAHGVVRLDTLGGAALDSRSNVAAAEGTGVGCPNWGVHAAAHRCHHRRGDGAFWCSRSTFVHVVPRGLVRGDRETELGPWGRSVGHIV